jgi:uncharacterized protein YcfJ
MISISRKSWALRASPFFTGDIKMNALLRTALAVAAVAIATQAAAQVTFYEREGFEGRSFTAEQEIRNFERFGFNDRASSVVVLRDRWEVCEDARFSGRCVVLRPGRYPSLAAMGLNNRVSSVRDVSRDARIDDNRYAPAPVAAGDHDVAAQVTFYEREGFEGRSFTTDRAVEDFASYGFNNRASSAVIRGGDRWRLCENTQFNRCFVLRPGRYPNLAAMGMNNLISSANPVVAPAPVADHDYRRGRNERLYEANVTSVRAVVGPPEQRCWVEREQVVQDRSSANVPGAIAGAVIGGILGHQVGGGRGQDLATVGGAVAGAAVGANVGRDGDRQVRTQDVQRCASVPSQARPDHWDVTYTFRGQEHRVQMTAPPGPTVTVNERGEPRE